jgi:hypothetical protein
MTVHLKISLPNNAVNTMYIYISGQPYISQSPVGSKAWCILQKTGEGFPTFGERARCLRLNMSNKEPCRHKRTNKHTLSLSLSLSLSLTHTHTHTHTPTDDGPSGFHLIHIATVPTQIHTATHSLPGHCHPPFRCASPTCPSFSAF